jgi:hypothetical protein
LDNKSGDNTAGIKQFNRDENKRIKVRQCKCLNNIVEHVVRHTDHRFIKRRTRPMLGVKSFWSGRRYLGPIKGNQQNEWGLFARTSPRLKWKQYKWGIGKKSTRILPVSYPKMVL